MPDYNKIIADSRRKLTKLVEQREAIESRIGQLTQVLRGFAPLLDPDQKEELLNELKAARKSSGLTKTITKLLASQPGVGFTTNDIRKHLEKEGFNLLE